MVCLDHFEYPIIIIIAANVRIVSILAGLPQLHLFGGFYSVHVRVISTLQMFLKWLN